MVNIPAHTRPGLPFGELPGSQPAACTGNARRMPFRLRMLHSLVMHPELTGRRLRAVEYLLLHACTHAPTGIGQRTLRSESEIDGVLSALPLVPNGQPPEPAVQLYRSLCDEVLSTRSFGELLAGDVLRRTRAVKYALGERYLHPCVLKAALHCLILIERLVDAPGYSDPRELRLRGWLRHRLPFEAAPAGRRRWAAPSEVRGHEAATDVVHAPQPGALSGAPHSSDGTEPHLIDDSPTFSGHPRQRRGKSPADPRRSARRTPPHRPEVDSRRPMGIIGMFVALFRAFIAFLVSGGRRKPPGSTLTSRTRRSRPSTQRQDREGCLKSDVAIG